MKVSSLLAAILIYSAAALAQTPVIPPDQQPLPAMRVVQPPALSETLELKRQNLVLRANLLAVQVENARQAAEREGMAISTDIKALRAIVEQTHPGWTLGDDGQVSALKPTVEPAVEPSAAPPAAPPKS